jgi:glycosyltransferase involved in cell wall biosynthesis
MSSRPISLLAAARAANRGDLGLRHARGILTRYEDAAEGFARAGRVEDAVAAAQLGASMASYRHPGVLVSPRLERVLAGLGARLRPFAPRPAPTGRVLHVASEVYAVGGHTRMIWRWIDRDRAHRHSLLVTGQHGDVPAGLLTAVRDAGGEAIGLTPGAPVMDRAQALRDAAAGADVVVVHAHPMDPLPALALADAPGRPPVVYFNHADHVFWLGASIADVVHCVRPVGAEMAGARGIAAERCLVTSAPVSGADGNGTAAAAERERERPGVLAQLGWPPDSVVLFSAGSLDKYRGPAGLTLLDLVDPVLRGQPRARLLVAGAVADDTWSRARARHAGRVAAVGPLPTLAPLFASADVYLESRPLGGPGVSSEAAAHGLPVLTHAGTPLEASLFCTDARYGATLVLGAGDYRRELIRLVGDPARRAELGAAAQAAIAATDAQWEASVERVYARVAELGPASVDALAPPDGAPGDRDLLVDQCLRVTHPALDADRMATLAANVALAGRSPAVRDLFGELVSMAAAPERRFPLAVAVPGTDPAALRAVIAEFLTLAAAGVADQFAIGLRPDQAEAALPVLEAALGDATLAIDVLVDAEPEALIRPDVLEVVAAGAPGTGRAARHVSAPPAG